VNIANLISEQRQLLGISQGVLAARAGISLPTVQKIEAGGGNPSLETLEALLRELGLKIEYLPRGADWEYLIGCGLPLSGGSSSQETPTRDRFLKELRSALVEMSHAGASDERMRKKEALDALLLALQGHFPGVYKELKRADYLRAMDISKMQGRITKLKRIAVSGLSRFL
jgi:transcriptional regulator with XRE-family HTH domain